MNISDIPKDVLVEVFKKLTLKDLIGIRLLNKHFNNIVKEKFKQLWFKKYIDIMTRTGNYANQYDIPVKKYHNHHVYIKDINLKIPYTNCYHVTQEELKNRHTDEFNHYFNEAVIVKRRLNENPIGINCNTNQQIRFEGQDNFENVYAYTKIIDKHCIMMCNSPPHYGWDVPIDENDNQWFDSHEIIYDKNKCYLSSYLFACYRVKRDNLDITGKFKGEKGYVRGKMIDKYKQSPFYNRVLKTYKCI